MQIFANNILRDKVAIVTGGGTGIGRSIALAMASCGADVVVASRDLSHLEATAAQIRAGGRRALPVQTDIRQTDQVDALLETAVKTLGRCMCW